MREASGPLVGSAVIRKEGRAKVTGAALYVDDVGGAHIPELRGREVLHGITVRSPASPSPRGRIEEVLLPPGDVPWEEFTRVDARDLDALQARGGANLIALINDDQPCLVDGVYNHPEEPVLLLAHPDRHLLRRARDAVRLRVTPLPAVRTIEEALAAEVRVLGDDNLIKQYLIDKGDVDGLLARAAAGEEGLRIFEGEYRTGAQEQLYIENNGMIALWTEEEGITVWGSLQCPYYVQKALCRLSGLPPERARVVQLETGGGFGGKEEYPSMLAAHAALLSYKAGRPVKMVYDRAEDMAATTKRHPSRTRHRTVVDREGRLRALDIDFVIDGGAYSTLSQVVLSRGAIHAAGPYACENVRVRARAVATSAPPHGAFRGFGAPQSIFALERHLDVIAAALGLAPEELRRRNFVRPGGTLATGQVVRDGVDMGALLDRALLESGFAERRRRFQEENRRSPRVKRGVGLCAFLHGTGFTGSGEKHLASQVTLTATAQGRVQVRSSSTEIGQGTSTVFAQIAADALGLRYEDVEVLTPDTQEVPNSGPTVASRTCTIVGRLVQEAAAGLRGRVAADGLLPAGAGAAQVAEALGRHVRERGALEVTTTYEQPPFVQWDEARLRGDAYGAFSWAVYVAQVRVDLSTYEAQVEDFVALQEVGRVIHPVLAAGQIEGGVAQGIGFALYERVVWKDGRMANNRMTDYIIPTSADIPPIRVFFEEAPYPYGAFGAKGIGELPMDGPAPAILNAIQDALGVSVREVPATPEVLLEALLEVADDAA